MLRLSASVAPLTIDGMFVLARRGLPMLRAKRAIESLIEDGRVFVDLPTVEDAQQVITDLAAARVEPPKTVDVRGLRKRLGRSREQFAIRYGLEVETVRNWETGKRAPDTTARSYLRVIEHDPDYVERASAPTPALS